MNQMTPDVYIGGNSVEMLTSSWVIHTCTQVKLRPRVRYVYLTGQAFWKPVWNQDLVVRYWQTRSFASRIECNIQEVTHINKFPFDIGWCLPFYVLTFLPKRIRQQYTIVLLCIPMLSLWHVLHQVAALTLKDRGFMRNIQKTRGPLWIITDYVLALCSKPNPWFVSWRSFCLMPFPLFDLHSSFYFLPLSGSHVLSPYCLY
jgi:hypothetical protein